MADTIPNSFLLGLAEGDFVIGTHAFKCALFQSTMTGYDVGTADVAYATLGNESSGTGYTAGGASCTVSVTQDNDNNRINIDVADVTFSTVTLSNYQYVVIYNDTTTPKRIMAVHDLGSANSVSSGDVTISFPNDSVRISAT